MRLYIDSADIEEIQSIKDYFPISGVTTNPTILSKKCISPFEQLLDIKKVIEDNMELHVQVVGEGAELMFREAERIRQILGEHTCIKVPVSQEGIKAMKMMAAADITVTATAIYTPMQALIAGMAGAKYAAPYVNRLAMIGQDGAQVAGAIHNLYQSHNINTQVLAASFKNVEQVLDVVSKGCGCITASPDIIRQLIAHPLTDRAVYDFSQDFSRMTSSNITMLDFPDISEVQQ